MGSTSWKALNLSLRDSATRLYAAPDIAHTCMARQLAQKAGSAVGGLQVSERAPKCADTWSQQCTQLLSISVTQKCSCGGHEQHNKFLNTAASTLATTTHAESRLTSAGAIQLSEAFIPPTASAATFLRHRAGPSLVT